MYLGGGKARRKERALCGTRTFVNTHMYIYNMAAGELHNFHTDERTWAMRHYSMVWLCFSGENDVLLRLLPHLFRRRQLLDVTRAWVSVRSADPHKYCYNYARIPERPRNSRDNTITPRIYKHFKHMICIARLLETAVYVQHCNGVMCDGEVQTLKRRHRRKFCLLT